jgi:hypothetical protein
MFGMGMFEQRRKIEQLQTCPTHRYHHVGAYLHSQGGLLEPMPIPYRSGFRVSQKTSMLARPGPRHAFLSD